MPEKITSKQEDRLADLFRSAVRALELTKDEAQEIIKAGGTMQNGVKPILQKLAITDQRFGPALVEFEMTVPADYNHDKQIDDFRKRVKKQKTTYYYNDALTSKNFAKATNKLEPGKTYKVKIFPILSTVTSGDCTTFLSKQNAILVGAQGETLVYDLHADKFPKGKYTVSFDEKDSLWIDSGGSRGVPRVIAHTGGDFEFGLGRFGDGWGAGVLPALRLRQIALGTLSLDVECRLFDPFREPLTIIKNCQGLFFIL